MKTCHPHGWWFQLCWIVICKAAPNDFDLCVADWSLTWVKSALWPRVTHHDALSPHMHSAKTNMHSQITDLKKHTKGCENFFLKYFMILLSLTGESGLEVSAGFTTRRPGGLRITLSAFCSCCTPGTVVSVLTSCQGQKKKSFILTSTGENGVAWKAWYWLKVTRCGAG